MGFVCKDTGEEGVVSAIQDAGVPADPVNDINPKHISGRGTGKCTIRVIKSFKAARDGAIGKGVTGGRRRRVARYRNNGKVCPSHAAGCLEYY